MDGSPLMYQAPAECFTKVATRRMIETMAANTCCMLPAGHGEGTFRYPHFVHKEQGTRYRLSGHTAGGQEQGWACRWRLLCSWEGGQPRLQ